MYQGKLCSMRPKIMSLALKTKNVWKDINFRNENNKELKYSYRYPEVRLYF